MQCFAADERDEKSLPCKLFSFERNHMLSSMNRISKADFLKVSKGGKVLHTPLFSVRYLVFPGRPTAFSVIASKKATKTAVRRNYERRRTYSALRAILKEEKVKKGFYCAVFLKENSLLLPFRELRQELKTVLFRAQVLETDFVV